MLDVKFTDKLVGLTKDSAIRIINHIGLTYRVVREDNRYGVITADFRVDRISLSLSNGKVVAANVG